MHHLSSVGVNVEQLGKEVQELLISAQSASPQLSYQDEDCLNIAQEGCIDALYVYLAQYLAGVFQEGKDEYVVVALFLRLMSDALQILEALHENGLQRHFYVEIKHAVLVVHEVELIVKQGKFLQGLSVIRGDQSFQKFILYLIVEFYHFHFVLYLFLYEVSSLSEIVVKEVDLVLNELGLRVLKK